MNDIKLWIFCLLLSSVSLPGCDKSSKRTYAENITINNCWFESQKNWPASECGVLTVPEDYSKPEGRKVKLPFIMFKAEEPNNKTYPLVVAGGGGPGGALGISHTKRDRQAVLCVSRRLDILLLREGGQRAHRGSPGSGGY